jgi:hypothetical protein
MLTLRPVSQHVKRRWKSIEIFVGRNDLFSRETGFDYDIIQWLDDAIGKKLYIVELCGGYKATFYFARKQDAATFKICWC